MPNRKGKRGQQGAHLLLESESEGDTESLSAEERVLRALDSEPNPYAAGISQNPYASGIPKNQTNHACWGDSRGKTN